MKGRVIGVAVAIALAVAAWLALPDRDAGGDLKQELADLSKDLRGRVDPLPQVKLPAPAKGNCIEEWQFEPSELRVRRCCGCCMYLDQNFIILRSRFYNLSKLKHIG